jgi:hypothetical protein
MVNSSNSVKTILTEFKNKPIKAAKKNIQDAQTVIIDYNPSG